MLLHGLDHLAKVADDPLARRRRVAPGSQVIGAHADDEIAGIREEFQVIPHLLRPVVADFARDAAVGKFQSQRPAQFLEEVWVGAVWPRGGGAKVVPARQAVAGAIDIDGRAGSLEGRCSLIDGVEKIAFHLLI